MMVFLIFALIISACSGESFDSRDENDAKIPGNLPLLSGKVVDEKGLSVSGVLIETQGKHTFSSFDGTFDLKQLKAGASSVKLSQPWFKEKNESIIIHKQGNTFLNLAIESWPMKIVSADRRLAEQYALSFDWTQDKISISVVERPSRKELDNALYIQNPALFIDRKNEPVIGPIHKADLCFELLNGDHKAQEAIDRNTIVDSIDETPLSSDEKADFMTWKPMLNWLKDRHLEKSIGINDVGTAIHKQAWNSQATQPQKIEAVYLHEGQFWIKIIFELFVQLEDGIHDSDGDGYKEIYAKINPDLYNNEIVNLLINEYIKPTFDTHGLSVEVGQLVNELYSTTAAVIEKTIGQPIDVNGGGKLNYPFVVLKHTGGVRNILLVEAIE